MPFIYHSFTTGAIFNYEKTERQTVRSPATFTLDLKALILVKDLQGQVAIYCSRTKYAAI